MGLHIKLFSLIHVILPALLLWMIDPLGYDTRAIYAQTLLIWVVLPVCFLATDPELPRRLQKRGGELT